MKILSQRLGKDYCSMVRCDYWYTCSVTNLLYNLSSLCVPVESCSMDVLRNSVKVFVDLNYVVYKGTCVQVENADGLTEAVLSRLNSYGH